MKLILLMATILIAPLAEAVEKINRRTPVGSALRSAEWEKMPLALRERSQFSAGVEEVRVMHTVQDGLRKLVGSLRNEKGVYTDRSKVIAEIGKVAEASGLTPRDEALRGTIQDITSERRAELIVDTQTQMTYGHTNWKAGQDRDMLEAFPAQELIRVEERLVKRDWGDSANGRWLQAARAVGDNDAIRIWGESGRMIALKTSRIWESLSRFGTPWPPFDFNSGMGVEDVSREEALALGLIKPRQKITPIEEDFNAKLEVTKSGIGDEEWKRLKDQFGDQIRFEGDRVAWHGTLLQEMYDRALATPTFKGSSRLGVATPKAVRESAPLGVDLSGAELRITADDIRHAHSQHGNRERRAGGQPLTRLDFEMAPHIWRDPDTVTRGKDDALVFRKDLGGELFTVVWKRSISKEGNTWGIKTLYKRRPA